MALSKVVVRTIKIFLIGLFLQGGYFHGPNSTSYGVNFLKLRFSGTLQRVAISFFIVGLSEIAVMKRYRENPPHGFWNLSFRFMLHWGIAVLLALFHVIVTFFLFVPDWYFPVAAPALNQPGISFVPQIAENTTNLYVACGKSGDLSPKCNAAGYLDRTFLGLSHLAQNPAFHNAKECTASSPLPGSLLPNAPNWCQAPFEAEGILGIVGGTLTAFAGLHFGHVLTHFNQHWVRLFHLTIFSGSYVAVGWFLRFPLKAELHRIFHGFPDWLILDFNGIPWNRQLYSLSYMFFTSGLGGLLLSFLYLLADVSKVRFYTKIFEWIGRNALLVYVLAVSGVLQAVLVGFYIGTPENNLVTIFQSFVSQFVQSPRYTDVLISVFSVVGWSLAAGFLTTAGHSWKF